MQRAEHKTSKARGDEGSGCNTGAGAFWTLVMLTVVFIKRKF